MQPPTKVIGRRVGAILIDSLIVFAFNAIVFFLMAQTEEDIIRGLGEGDIDLTTSTYFNLDLGDDQYSLVGSDFTIWLLITTVVGILYWMVLPGLKGWTVGKLITGIRVVKDDGTCPAGIGKNVVRQLLWIADYFPYFIPYLTGFIVALTNDRNKRVGDIVAGTLVVRASAAGQPIAAGAGAAPGARPFVAQQAMAGPAAADWYPDPQGQKRLRYWDGTAWTEHTAD